MVQLPINEAFSFWIIPAYSLISLAVANDYFLAYFEKKFKALLLIIIDMNTIYA